MNGYANAWATSYPPYLALRERTMRHRFLLFITTLIIAPQLFAAEFPTGILKGAGFVVEKGNQKITEKDLSAYSSSATVLKLSDGRYQLTIVANLQKTSSIAAKVDKRVDIYRIICESPTTGVLLNSNNEFKDDKSSFTISNDQLIIKSWVARSQLWETQYYSLVK